MSEKDIVNPLSIAKFSEKNPVKLLLLQFQTYSIFKTQSSEKHLTSILIFRSDMVIKKPLI